MTTYMKKLSKLIRSLKKVLTMKVVTNSTSLAIKRVQMLTVRRWGNSRERVWLRRNTYRTSLLIEVVILYLSDKVLIQTCCVKNQIKTLFSFSIFYVKPQKDTSIGNLVVSLLLFRSKLTFSQYFVYKCMHLYTKQFENDNFDRKSNKDTTKLPIDSSFWGFT